MKRIRLTNGQYTEVSDEDYEYLNQWNWYCSSYGYAYRKIGNQNLFLHREVLKPKAGEYSDHINGIKLDNQRTNLRLCTYQENLRNKPKRVGSFSSKYKGVSWSKRWNTWRAYVYDKGKSIWIGNFDNEVYAAMAYDLWAKDLYGKFAKTNFTALNN